MDYVPTLGFDLLYAFIIIRLDRRLLVWSNVTRHPTAEWIARQIKEALPWDEAPRYLIRDRDCIYGNVARRRLRAMGIRDTRDRAQITVAERIRRTFDWFDPPRVCRSLHIFGEEHLRRILRRYARYHNDVRTHRSLDKDAPNSRAVERFGWITSRSLLGGLHHHYARI